MKLAVSLPVVVYVDCTFDVEQDWDQDHRYDDVMRISFEKTREFCKSVNFATKVLPGTVPEITIEEIN